MIEKNQKIFVAGHRGMVGSAIVRELELQGYSNIAKCGHEELDLIDQSQVQKFFAKEKPEYVVIAAAKVGGIHANNTYPADFIYSNLMVECNLIQAAHQHDCQDLLFLGSSCIYPRLTSQPMREDSLLTGTLEPTNEPYAIAKIAGIKLCESYNRQYGTDFRSVMPTNLYGPNDNFHPENSHVIPALIRRIHEAKVNKLEEVVIWGSGTPKREFLHVDDMAAASVHVMQLSSDLYKANTEPMLSHINIGTGKDVTIRELAETLVSVIEFEGKIVYDCSKSDGTPRKLMDVGRLKKLGWEATRPLKDGLSQSYNWFLQHLEGIRQ